MFAGWFVGCQWLNTMGLGLSSEHQKFRSELLFSLFYTTLYLFGSFCAGI